MMLSEFILGFAVAVIVDVALFMWAKRAIRSRHALATAEELLQDKYRAIMIARSAWTVTVLIAMVFGFAYPKIVASPCLAGILIFALVLCAGCSATMSEFRASAQARLKVLSGRQSLED